MTTVTPPTAAPRRGPLVILSGPSGTGKSTVIRRLLASGRLPLRLSVSATTRKPRPGERDGVDYNFWDVSAFERAVAAGEFLEYARVHGNYYGTLAREVEPWRQKGVGVILDIDVQGAEQVWRNCPDHHSIFLSASGLEEYERRLRARGTEDEATLQRRLVAAEAELAHAPRYRDRVVNDNLDAAVQQVGDLLAPWFAEGERDAG